MSQQAAVLLLARARTKERGKAKEKTKTKALREKIGTVIQLGGPARGGAMIIMLGPGMTLAGSILITLPMGLVAESVGTSDSFPAARPNVVNIKAAMNGVCAAALRPCLSLPLSSQDPPGRVSSAASRCVQLHVHVASHSRSSRLR